MTGYVNFITGEVLPFKTQFTENPVHSKTFTEESRTVSTDYEPVRNLINRVKRGEVSLLRNFMDDFTEDESKVDNDHLDLDVAAPDELFDDITDRDNAREYLKALAAETSERSADNTEAQKAAKTAPGSGKGQESDNGANADDDASGSA